jgi:DNA polymerase
MRYFFYKPKKKKILKRLKVFLSKVGGTDVKISHEHKGYVWLNFEEARSSIRHKNMRDMLDIANEYAHRYERINALNNEYRKISSTKNWDLSKRLVPGEGPLDSGIMVIGQAPGKNEDQDLKPFIGRSGNLLTGMLAKAGLDRKKLYITSVVQFFPPKNRLPTRFEVDVCRPFIKKQIEILKPKFIILLGNIASMTLLGIGSVEKNHGRCIRKDDTEYMITFHPAAILRFKDKAPLMLGDLKKFSDIINKHKN